MSLENLMTGSLGDLVPEAAILCFGDYYGSTTPPYWTVCTTAEIDHKWQQWPTPEEALAEAESFGYVAANFKRDGAIDLIHPATQAALEERKAATTAKWADAKPCYVRFGKLPPHGRSRNHADGTLEEGVSVFHGERLPSGEARPLPKTNQELASLLSLSRTRDLYIVTGEEIGVGSDGEPLLRNARIWRKAK